MALLWRNIYDCALCLINEQGGATDGDDFEERAPYLAAALLSEARSVDRAYRAAAGLHAATEGGGSGNAIAIPLEREFDLSERFATPAACYMAAMLILDENDSLYETLFDRWCSGIASICAEIPFVAEQVKDVYGSLTE